ncbi:protein CIST1-like [Scomber scombrus]|uniref:protein CIST1-like n=1 Tax=Scomber scombrus TaxID=13677 RepID=UPI002DD9F633|nr:protein CIST1-like [Scomber scombrus]
MPAAMHLTVLMSLFAVTFSESTVTSSSTTQVKTIPTSAEHITSVTPTNEVTSPTVSHLQQSTTHQISTEVTSDKVSSPTHTSPQTPDRTKVTHPITSSQTTTTTTNQTSNETVSHSPTVQTASDSPNITETTTANASSPALPIEWKKGDLAANPGLVAVLCIFCIVLFLVLVVAVVKCAQSPRSNFERLEDVPMGKMNEESPFAQYSK